MDHRHKGCLAMALLSEMHDSGAITNQEFEVSSKLAFSVMAGSGREASKLADEICALIQRSVGGVIQASDECFTPVFDYEDGQAYCGLTCYGRDGKGQCRFGWSDPGTDHCCPGPTCPGMVNGQEVHVLLRRKLR